MRIFFFLLVATIGLAACQQTPAPADELTPLSDPVEFLQDVESQSLELPWFGLSGFKPFLQA